MAAAVGIEDDAGKQRCTAAWVMETPELVVMEVEGDAQASSNEMRDDSEPR
jgi:hypothetical protein